MLDLMFHFIYLLPIISTGDLIQSYHQRSIDYYTLPKRDLLPQNADFSALTTMVTLPVKDKNYFGECSKQLL